MTLLNQKLQKKVYESKKARDILDEEFTEFLPIKRNINEFFDLYTQKFYNISENVHKFFINMSLKYVIDYINPKKLQLQEIERQRDQMKIDIDSFENFHPIFSNNIVLQQKSVEGTPDSQKKFFLLQSGKKRKIKNLFLLNQIKDIFKLSDKPINNWTINVGVNTIYGISSGPDIETKEDIQMSIYQINTGKELPSNIYTR